METSLAERLLAVILTVVAIGSVVTLSYALVAADPTVPTDNAYLK